MKSLAHLDVLRLISVALVMYGHFVLVAGGAKVIPNIIGPTVALPLIDESRWKAYLFEVFLIEKCSTQAAILGVSLFFLITGYLMPMMCDRYSRLQFIVNRLFRIVPTLVVGVVALGIFLQQTQGIVFSLSSYLASITLTYEYLEITPVAGVLAETPEQTVQRLWGEVKRLNEEIKLDLEELHKRGLVDDEEYEKLKKERARLDQLDPSDPKRMEGEKAYNSRVDALATKAGEKAEDIGDHDGKKVADDVKQKTEQQADNIDQIEKQVERQHQLHKSVGRRGQDDKAKSHPFLDYTM